MKNLLLSARTAADIDAQVAKVLRGLDNPDPPVDLSQVRELLKLDRAYYSTTDTGILGEMVSRLKIAGRQVLLRPTLLADAVRNLSLKALYLPDQKRILLDNDVPPIKHRWNEAHEIGHELIPWHAGMMLGDTEKELTPACHAQMEAEANFAAGQLLFLSGRFVAEARSSPPSLDRVQALKAVFGNTLTSTLWRYVEQANPALPMIGLVTGHPHASRRKPDFDPTDPCRYCIQSPAFAQRFGHITEIELFRCVARYCGAQRGGTIGSSEVVLIDAAGEQHHFHFETFFNRYEALTLGVWQRLAPTSAGFR